MPSTPALASPPVRVTHADPVIKLALAGCGVVGSELMRLLSREAEHIRQAHGVRFEVNRILIRDAERERNVDASRDLFTNSLDDFLQTPADVVVEAIGGLDPALRIAQSAVQRGARFITANKALIAAHGTELQSAAHTRGAHIHFEAAVGGSVPVIRVLREALGTTRPRTIRGILNGTANFVLTRVEQGRSLADAIAEAQQRGLAEADPARDLDGRDAADKIAILTWLAHGVQPDRVQVHRSGLIPHIERIVQDAAAVDAKARLIAECVVSGGDVAVNVEPVIVSADSAFGRTTCENNLIVIDLGWGAPLELAGPGAGGPPTASALLGDLLSASARLTIPADRLRCISDQRSHGWSVSVARRERDALQCFQQAGIAIRLKQSRFNATCFHTEPITRERLQAVLAEVEQLDAAPVAVRLELGEGN